jgi:hypothetical protein
VHVLGALQTFAVWAQDAGTLAAGLDAAKRRLSDRASGVI